jgi:hypothetical protein
MRRPVRVAARASKQPATWTVAASSVMPWLLWIVTAHAALSGTCKR